MQVRMNVNRHVDMVKCNVCTRIEVPSQTKLMAFGTPRVADNNGGWAWGMKGWNMDEQNNFHYWNKRLYITRGLVSILELVHVWAKGGGLLFSIDEGSTYLTTKFTLLNVFISSLASFTPSECNIDLIIGDELLVLRIGGGTYPLHVLLPDLARPTTHLLVNHGELDHVVGNVYWQCAEGAKQLVVELEHYFFAPEVM